MTVENLINPLNRDKPQEKNKDVPENGIVDYAAIIARTLEHSFVRPKGITLADAGIVLTAKPIKVIDKDTSSESTVQEDNNLFNLEADLSRKRRGAKVERKKTGRHIRLREG